MISKWRSAVFFVSVAGILANKEQFSYEITFSHAGGHEMCIFHDGLMQALVPIRFANYSTTVLRKCGFIYQ